MRAGLSCVCKTLTAVFLKLQGQSESPGKVVFLWRACTHILGEKKKKRHDLRRVLSVPQVSGVSTVPSQGPCPAQGCLPPAAELWTYRSALRPTWPPHVKQRWADAIWQPWFVSEPWMLACLCACQQRTRTIGWGKVFSVMAWPQTTLTSRPLLTEANDQRVGGLYTRPAHVNITSWPVVIHGRKDAFTVMCSLTGY